VGNGEQGRDLSFASGVRLLERERETELLARALADARSGRGAAVLVEGAAGIGKTRLLDFARREGHARGVEMLSARGMELERNFGWGIVRQLFERWLLNRPMSDRERLLNGPAEITGGTGAYARATGTVTVAQSPSAGDRFTLQITLPRN
jgi:hypothetical protein